MAKSTIKKTYRRADTGTYTTEEYANKHPNTTVKETDKIKTIKKPSTTKK
jgi:hypothetical protein